MQCGCKTTKMEIFHKANFWIKDKECNIFSWKIDFYYTDTIIWNFLNACILGHYINLAIMKKILQNNVKNNVKNNVTKFHPY